jgi:hypothetical protein
VREGEIIASEHHSRSPAGRWYTPVQAIRLYEEAGSASDLIAKDTVFSVLGQRP